MSARVDWRTEIGAVLSRYPKTEYRRLQTITHYRLVRHITACGETTDTRDLDCVRFTDEYQGDPHWYVQVTCPTCKQHPDLAAHWDIIESKIAQQYQK